LHFILFYHSTRVIADHLNAAMGGHLSTIQRYHDNDR